MQTSCPWYQLTFLGVLQMRIDKVQIWVDAEMAFESALPREVTDCKGNILELGDYNIPSLGEMIFAANALNQQIKLRLCSDGLSCLRGKLLANSV